MQTNRIFRGFCMVRHRSLTLHFEPFRSWLRILGDIHIRTTTPRLNDTGSRRLSASLIRGVDDSPHHRYGESAIEFFIRKLAVSVIRRVVDSAYRLYGESPTPRIVESGSQ